ncbi:MAG: hypothetical protein M0Q91_00770 [Methanoregula sp.]|jgi:hypothetical protein|nr:hypothetical protein [Methanoregula sp.]
MGEKKKKEDSMKTVKQVLVVGACVLFVVLMVISGMGSGWLTIFTSVKQGDSVVLDYTLFDAAGNPIVTSEKAAYDQALAQGREIFGSKQLTIVSNQTMEKPIYPVPVYASSGSSVKQLAIFPWEFDAISTGIVGMKVNEQKRITISSNMSMTQFMSTEDLATIKLDLNNVSIGDNFYGLVPENAEEYANNTTSNNYLRIGEVSDKAPEGIEVDFSYSAVDIRVISINNR